eukprot:SAG31_NODE_4410_length_3255_cov_1.558935_5_plen_31_part_01
MLIRGPEFFQGKPAFDLPTGDDSVHQVVLLP